MNAFALSEFKSPTPLEPAPESVVAFAYRERVWLKREDLNPLGVFKWRSTLPVARHLLDSGPTEIVTCSTGNHGAAVAWACRELGAKANVFVPPNTVEAKMRRLEALKANVVVSGDDFDSAKENAERFAEERDLPFFEDGAEPLRYEAYRSIGEEILDQAPRSLDTVVIPVGNGALAGGVGAAIGERDETVTRIGVVASAMPVMADSFDAGRPVAAPIGKTIADGLAVRVAISLAVTHLRHAVDVMLRVSEREIASALVAYAEGGIEVEPSAAAALAALRQRRNIREDGASVLVVTGCNVDPQILERARRSPESFPAQA
jgi:threonine dehydratase